MTRIGLMARLRAFGFDKPYVRLVRVNKDDKTKIDAHVTAYAMISKNDNMPTVRLVFQDFTNNGRGSVAITYDMGRIATWASKLMAFINAVQMARALAMAGVVQFYDDTATTTGQAGQAQAPQPSQPMAQPAVPAASPMANIPPQLMAQLMAMMAQMGQMPQGQAPNMANAPAKKDKEEEAHGERIEL